MLGVPRLGPRRLHGLRTAERSTDMSDPRYVAERLTAPGDSLAERERSREMAALVEARLRRLRGDTP